MTRESQFRQDANRNTEGGAATDDKGWLRELPVADMVNYGWIDRLPPGDSIAACLKFFGVRDILSWRETYRDVLQKAAFRTSPSFESQPGSVAAWFRQGEIKGGAIMCEPWSATRFRDALAEIRLLTRKKNPSIFIPELKQMCSACGVAVVIVRSPTGCRASGATRFLSTQKALLLLSFRYLSDDHFWFTFFHEAGHLLLHREKGLFLEGMNVSGTEETEANEFAAQVLIPSPFRETLPALRLELRSILKFARLVGVSPGIVIGQLQHSSRVPRSHWNTLKYRFAWQEIDG
jgi:Zn-dependent peptidase ImmA (M78 family)